MAGLWVIRSVQVVLVLLLSCGAAQVRAADGTDLIGVETGGSAGITIRQAEDLASLVDDGTTRRLVPVVGQGGVRAISDLLDGRGVDMAFLQLDVLDYARAQRLFPDLETRISYIARLNYVEFHLLARPEVIGIGDLAGKIVDVGPPSGDTAITAARLFGLLKVAPVVGNDEPALAIDKLRRGEIGAVAFVGGKPAPLLRLANTNGLHLVPVPLTSEVIAAYVPSKLNATDYPGLVAPDAAVDTVAVATGLFVGPVAAGSRRISQTGERGGYVLHPVPDAAGTGSSRQMGRGQPVQPDSRLATFRCRADEWLKRNAAVAAGQDLRMIFMRFLDERAKASGGQMMTQEQKDALFDQFRRWQTGQSN